MGKKINRDFVKIRSFLAYNVDTLLENLNVRREANKIDSEDLFGSLESDNESSINWKKDYKKLPILDILIAEKDSLGLYVSGNPLEKYLTILNWARETSDRDNLHLILVDKIKKIFTKTNQMMFALEITTPNIEERLEGIIFPKNALGLSPKLEENKLFWVRGNIIEDKRKKKKKEEVPADDIQEYAEIPKLAIDYLVPFREGIGKLFENEEISIPLNRVKKLNSINWEDLEKKPQTISDQIEKTQNQEPTSEITSTTKIIKISRNTTPKKITEIKKHLKKEEFAGADKVSLEIEKTEGWKKVKGVFWADYNKILELLEN